VPTGKITSEIRRRRNESNAKPAYDKIAAVRSFLRPVREIMAL
jgi:hypothetical protein